MKRSILFVFILCAFGGILFFYNLGGWDLWNPDEPRYAQIAREMLQGEGWVIPHLNSEVYLDKPPLFFWLIAAAAKGLGEMNECAARLPSAAFGLLTLMLTFFLGKRLFSEKVGFFAALILATNAEFFWLARRANIDATLTFFTTAAIALFYVGFYRQKGRGVFYLLAYLAMALGVLAKLQIGVIVPVLVVGGYLLLQREIRFFKDSSHIPGIVLFVVFIGAWLYSAYLSGGGDYLWGLLYEKTASTFFKTASHHRPIYYYFVRFPADFIPWIIFLPSALIYGLSAKGRKKEFIFLFFWFAIIFAFFTLSKTKRELYLLPLYPAAALMVGYLLGEFPLDAEGVKKRLVVIPLFVLIITSVLAAIGVPIMAVLEGARYLEHAGEIGLIFSLILYGGGFLCVLAYYYRQLNLPFYLIVAMMFASSLYATARILPEINRYKSARPLSQSIVSSMGPGDQLGVYRLEGAEYNYYTGLEKITRISTEEELNSFLRSPQVVFCIMRQRHYERLKANSTLQFYVILRGKVGHRKLAIVSNRKADSAVE